MALFLPFAAVMDVCLFGTRGLHRLRPLVTVDKIGRPLLQVALVAVCIAVGADSATPIALAWAGPYLPAAIVAAVWLWHLLAHVERKRGVEAPEAGTMHREFWGYSWPRWLQSIAQIGLQRLDIILSPRSPVPRRRGRLRGRDALPRLRAARGRLIGAVAQPRLSRLLALGDPEGVRTVYRVSTTWLILCAWPIYLGFVVFSEQMPLVFGPKYAPGRRSS